jgi:hypothetical protein
MRWLLAAGFTALLLAPAGRASEDPPDSKKRTPRQQFQAVNDDYTKAMQAFQEAYQKAKTPEEKNKVSTEKYPDQNKFAERFMAVATSAPKDPAAVDALIWVVQFGGVLEIGGGGPKVVEALKQLAADHVADRRMGDVAPRLVYSFTPAAEKLLRGVIEKNPDRAAKGKASLALGQWLKHRAEIVQNMQADPGRIKQMDFYFTSQGFDKVEVTKLSQANPDVLMKEAEATFERTVKEFGDVSQMRSTVGKLAEAELYEIRFLAIGKPVPEIAGEDIDGKSFKLSDYKGKVVVVDFWGDW